jgi:photosystem II stability/assembly factor-like uncharacterized protein
MKTPKLIFTALTVSMFFVQIQITNAQINWTEQTSGTSNDLFSIQFLDADNGYAVGESGTVLKTTDGGLNWTNVSPASSGNVQDLSFITKNEGYIVMGDPSGWPTPATTSGELWYTANGGTSWTQISFGHTASRLAVHFLSSTNGWIVGTHHDHSWPWPPAEQTSNGGSNWTPGSSALTMWIYDIQMDSPTLGWMIGNDQSNAGIVQNTTDGNSWSTQSIPTTEALYGLDFNDASNGYAVGDAGTVIGTSNGGSSWTTQSSGTSSNLQSISFGTVSHGFACGSGGTIISTTNSGSTWTTENTGTTTDLNGIYNFDGTNAWAVGNDGLILNWNETVSTKDVEEESLFNLYPNPFSANATLEFENSQNENHTLTLYDLQGRIVRTITDITSDQVIIEKDNLTGGMYFFQLRTDKGVRATGKLAIE